MARFVCHATFAGLLILAVLAIGLGCSHDNATAPTQTSSSLDLAKPVFESNSFVETFDNHQNIGRWSFLTDHRPVYEEDGGNTDGYLHDDFVITFAPSAGTKVGEESIFTGNYREKKITSIGIDLRSIDYQYDITNRNLTLILMNDNGTPDDVEDDWGAYIIGPQKLPSKYVAWLSSTEENQPGWVSYDFEIESQGTGLPEGWNFWRYTLGGGNAPGGSWGDLMENVSYVQFYYGDPELFYILQIFDLGLDNARISWE